MRTGLRSQQVGWAIGWILFSVVLVASCAAKRAAVDSDFRFKQAGSSAPSESSPPGASRLLVKTASIEITVSSVPNAADEAVRITEQAGGYVHESSTERDGRGRFALRVPAAQLDVVLDQLSKLGEEKNRHVSTEDVTDRVTDLDAELANKRALRDRLRALLARAKDVKDVLAVENELTRVQTDIDSLEGRLKKTREDITFSSISLTLRPPEPEKQPRILGPLGYLYVGTKWFITKLFVIRPGSDD
jgi:hypothetical protein